MVVGLITLYLCWENYTHQKEAERIFINEIAGQVLNGNEAGGQDSLFYEGFPVYVFRNNGNGIVQTDEAIENSREVGRDKDRIENKEINLSAKANEILALEQQEGVYENFRFLYREPVLVMFDESEWKENNLGMIQGMAAVFLILSVIIVALSALISGWLTRPVRQAFEQQRQFVSDASHELKTPLTVISANAQRLHKEIGANRWLGYILEENDRMGRLLEELLILARMENSSVGTEHTEFDLSRALTGVLLPYESEAFENGIHFYMEIEEECRVTGQEEHLKQAAVILVDNAIHHTSKEGSVWVRLFEKKDRVILEVANTGEEIPKEERKKIFQRFYQSDKAFGRKENRHGLGLAIADAIVRRHRGKINVECSGGITTFTIVLRK